MAMSLAVLDVPSTHNAGAERRLLAMSANETTSSAPSLGLLIAEGRALLEMGSFIAASPLLRQLPSGDGQAVLVLPGLLAGDGSTLLLRRLLRSLGYDAHGWRLGRNYGTHSDLEVGAGPAIASRLREVAEVSKRPVSLIGWSLGGLYARELARHHPSIVRQVITLGSPFKGDHRANNVYKIFERVSGYEINSLPDALNKRMGEAPPVPTTAIFSKSDGIAAWQCCVETAGEFSESIEVHGSHCGLGFNPSVAWAIADRLALPEGKWTRFERSGVRRAAFGSLTA
jgi:pimeloyl-ACP methyl ester carboxylesterase